MLWPIVRRKFLLPLPVLMFGVFMFGVTIVAHEIAVTPWDVLFIGVLSGSVSVLWLTLAAESHVRLVRRQSMLTERRNALFRGYLRQRQDGANATHHVAHGCRCQHLSVGGSELLVTVSPCQRVTW